MSNSLSTPISNKFLFVLLTSLYFSQGFPSGLLAHGLPAIMREYGSSLTAIGFLKLLALPWLFKFLWAPLLDRFYYAPLGPHRSWILVMQGGAILTLLCLSLLPPEWMFGGMSGDEGSGFGVGLLCLFALLLCLNMFSSTQDIATDGLAVTLLSEKLRGIGNSIQVCGYKIGLMLGGSGLLILMDYIGWSLTVQLVAITLAVMLIPTLLFNENKTFSNLDSNSNRLTLNGFNFWAFFKQRHILSWLAVLLTYKLADGVSSTLVKPMLIDLDFSLTEVGEITFVSSLAGLIGAVLVGLLYSRMKPIWLLMGFAFLQMLSISAYSLIPGLDPQSEDFLAYIYWIVIQDQIVDTMSTVVLFAFMMGHCRKSHEGGDYTLQACIQVLSAGVAGAFGGVIGDMVGDYSSSFLVAGSLAVCPLVALFVYTKHHKFLGTSE